MEPASSTVKVGVAPTDAEVTPKTAAPRADRGERREEIKLRLEYVKLVFSLISALGILFIVVQLAMTNGAADQAVYQTMTTTWNEHLKTFVDKPGLRPYFFENLAITEKDPLRNQVQALADVRLDVMDAILSYAAPRWPKDEGFGWHSIISFLRIGPEHSLVGWENTFRGAFLSSPTLCDRYSKTREMFGYLVGVGDETCEAPETGMLRGIRRSSRVEWPREVQRGDSRMEDELRDWRDWQTRRSRSK